MEEDGGELELKVVSASDLPVGAESVVSHIGIMEHEMQLNITVNLEQEDDEGEDTDEDNERHGAVGITTKSAMEDESSLESSVFDSCRNVRKSIREQVRAEREQFVISDVDFGSFNYPEADDEEETCLIFFDNEPWLFDRLMAWDKTEPEPPALKIWQDMLNDEFLSGGYQTPLNIFYRIFLNRQLGDQKHQIVRYTRCTRKLPEYYV